MTEPIPALQVRPYEVLSIIARAERYRTIAGPAADLRHRRLTDIWGAVRREPFVPLTLRANVESHYRYQNPGAEEGTSEGALFELKRDLDILQRLGLFPGATKPAREVFGRVFQSIPRGEGILWYAKVTGPAWRGSSDPGVRAYDAAIARGLADLFPPRSMEEREAAKRASASEISGARALRVRPHHILCATCTHGRTLMGRPEDRVEDNQHEILDAVRADPNIPITLVAGCCMVCPPCPEYDGASGMCRGGSGTMMLRDQKKDLDLLQMLGLAYGDTLPARRLLAMVFRAVRETRQVCGYGDGVARSPEWSVCGGVVSEEYARGRAAGWGALSPEELR